MSAGAAVLDYASAKPPRAEPVPPDLRRVFGWLLWGDFVLVLMEQLVPSLAPILLKQHNLSNISISLIMGTIPTAFGLLIMPIVSYRSDQLRTRFGRRIPFLLVTAPLIMASLCLIPMSPLIGGWLERVPWLQQVLTSTALRASTLIFAVTLTSYTFFNAVCSACYSYLLPDIVPSQFMGRFTSLFRIFSLAGVFVFNYFVMGLAETHMKEVFIGAAIVYGIGFLIVCLKVKEPAYPPPTDKRTINPIAVFASYARECFRHPIYIWVYAAFILYGFSQIAGNLFDVLFLKETLGMDLGVLGKMRAWVTIAPIPLAYFGGRLVDRWRSQRAVLVCALLMAVCKLLCFFFVVGPVSYLVWSILYNIAAFFWGVSITAYLVSTLPKDRYGQFLSCNVFLSSLAMMVANPVCGTFFEMVQNYRFVYLWPAVLMVPVMFALWQANRQWIRCGGPENYQAP